MNEIHRKILSILDHDIICEFKSAKDQVPSPLIFHNHDGCELYLLLDGEVNYYTESGGKRLERGDLILTRPYAFHGSVRVSPAVHDRIVINVRESLLSSLETPETELAVCFLRTPPAQLNLLHLEEADIRRFTDIALQLQNELLKHPWGSDVMSRALLSQLLVMTGRLTVIDRPREYPGIMPDFLAETFSYIEDHLCEKIALNQLAEHVHLNGTYLNRRFRKLSGASLTQYILAKRIALAQKLLREGHSPCDACELSGFNDYSNFSRSFSRQAGCSPREYQKAVSGPRK